MVNTKYSRLVWQLIVVGGLICVLFYLFRSEICYGLRSIILKLSETRKYTVVCEFVKHLYICGNLK